MVSLADFSRANIDLVFFIYGTALVLMGLAALLEPKKQTGFPMKDTFHLLGWASIVHGVSVYLDMWALIKGYGSPAFALAKLGVLLTSYSFLFEFGRRSLLENKGGCSPGFAKTRLLGWQALPVLIVLLFGLAAFSTSFSVSAHALARYVISFPGTLLAGAAFISYARCQSPAVSNPAARKYFMLAGAAFLAYGAVGGLIPTKAAFFPADIINADSFFAATGLPVQLLRAAFAGLITWGVIGALRVFNWERDEIIQGVVFDNSRDCIANVGLDGKVLAMNGACLKAYELAGPWELTGKDAAGIMTPDPQGFRGALRRADGGEVTTLRYSALSRTRGEVWWDATVSPVRGLDQRVKSVLCVAKDITDQRRHHETQATLNDILSLAIEEAPLESVLESVLARVLAVTWLGLLKQGAILLTDPAGKYLSMKAQLGLDGKAQRTCANVPFGHCLCGKAALKGQTIFAEELDERHEVRFEGMLPHGHYCLPIKAGSKVLGVLTLYVPNGHKYEQAERDFLEAVASIIAKVLEYKALESKANQSQKMESLGRFAGAIAHDFNNILTGIKGFNSIALESLPKNSNALKYLQEAAAGIDKGSGLIRQILAFSRSQPAEMTVLDLNSVIEGLEKMLQMVLEKKVSLKLALEPGLPGILGNKSQLEQILVNLAVNARDAMPEGGNFSITTQAGGSCPVDMEPGQNPVRLSIADTGCGIPESLLARVFEPFFTTKPEGKGTGLGLPTVYSMVKLHKGAINVTSVQGRGTAFDICFPAAGVREPAEPARRA